MLKLTNYGFDSTQLDLLIDFYRTFFPLYVHCCDDLDRIHLEWPVTFGMSNFKRAFVLLVKKQSVIIKVQL